MSPNALQIKVGVGVVILKDDHILLIKRATAPRLGEWSIPGGKVELGETTRQAAIREVREETSVEITLDSLLDVVDFFNYNDDGALQTQYCLVDYMAQWASGEPIAGDDAAEAKWFTRAQIDDLGLWQKTITIIDQAISLHKAKCV